MRSRFPSLLPVLLAPLLTLAETGEDAWCGICSNFFDRAEHAEVHEGAAWCDTCLGFYLGVGSKSHVHVGETPPPAECPRCGTALGEDGKCPNCDRPPPPACPRCGTALGEDGKCPNCDLSPYPSLPRIRKYLKWGVLAVGGFFLLSLLLSILVRLVRARPEKRGFRYVGGVPQGIVLKPGVLVCDSEGVFDGGTSQVYEARFRNGGRGKWEPAFVKRIIGASMRSDQRFPMIEFESNILKRLGETGAVPRVLVDPDTVALSDGSHWSYYAMSAAQGEPWPEHGGLGRDTHVALAALCEALMRLHDLGIGHHDLKPQNIFWDPRRKQITLLDFGSAIDHTGEFVNPIGGTMTGTKPWIPPASDGKILADLTVLSDNWVYGLLFCEAILGCIVADDRTQRHTPEKPEDRDWLRENLARKTSPAIAEAVVDGLFAFDKTRRKKLQEFLELIRKDWGV